jgi:hypothetical protein
MSALLDAVKHIQYSADNENDVKWGNDAAAELAAKDKRITDLEKIAREVIETFENKTRMFDALMKLKALL